MTGNVYRVRGPNGAIVAVRVPSPGMDQRTFDKRVAEGEFVILNDTESPAATVEAARPTKGSRKQTRSTRSTSSGGSDDDTAPTGDNE